MIFLRRGGIAIRRVINNLHNGFITFLKRKRCMLGDTAQITVYSIYTPHEGLNLANQKRRKFGVSDRKLEGSHSHSSVILINIVQSLSSPLVCINKLLKLSSIPLKS